MQGALASAALTFASLCSGASLEFGISTALTGPAQELGKNIQLGINTAFQRVNNSGGVGGNTLSLIALDDQYEPGFAATNMRQLITKEKVTAVVGNVGTPTAVVTVPIANELKTLLFGAYTGAGLLRKDPPDRYVINYRASYAEETGAMVDYLLGSGIKAKEIAFFTQNDGYGDSGYNGALQALKKHGFTQTNSLAHGRYQRNTTNVEDGLATILGAATPPKAIIMVGAYAPCAAFIKLARDVFPDTRFLNVSFVGSAPLAKALGHQGDGVIVTQVVPHFNTNLPIVAQYRSDLKAFNPTAAPNFISLEGYIVGRILAEGIRHSGKDVTRESLIDGLESLSQLDIGLGFPITLDGTNHQASHKIWPTHIRAGKYHDGWE